MKTSFNLFIIPSDLEYFQAIAESHTESVDYPGLMEINVEGVDPDGLKDHLDRMFFGMHGGLAGSHTAKLVFCVGGGKFYTHPCDEEGRISMSGNAVWTTRPAPFVLSAASVNFMVAARKVVTDMLDEAATQLRAEMEKIEKENPPPEPEEEKPEAGS